MYPALWSRHWIVILGSGTVPNTDPVWCQLSYKFRKKDKCFFKCKHLFRNNNSLCLNIRLWLSNEQHYMLFHIFVVWFRMSYSSESRLIYTILEFISHIELICHKISAGRSCKLSNIKKISYLYEDVLLGIINALDLHFKRIHLQWYAAIYTVCC